MIRYTRVYQAFNRFWAKRIYWIWNKPNNKKQIMTLVKHIKNKVDKLYEKFDKGKVSDKVLTAGLVLIYKIKDDVKEKKIITLSLENFEFLHIDISIQETIEIEGKKTLKQINLWFIIDLTKENLEQQEIIPTIKFYHNDYLFIIQDLVEATNLLLKHKREIKKAFNKAFRQFLKDSKNIEKHGQVFAYSYNVKKSQKG